MLIVFLHDLVFLGTSTVKTRSKKLLKGNDNSTTIAKKMKNITASGVTFGVVIYSHQISFVTLYNNKSLKLNQ